MYIFLTKKFMVQFNNTPTHLQLYYFPILFPPDAELPSLKEIPWISKG